MADGSLIEWTDLELEGGRATGRGQSHVDQYQHVKQFSLGLAPVCFKPLPDVLSALAAIAGTAGRHDVARLSQAPRRDRSNVVPACRRLVAVGAETSERFGQDFLSFDRQRGNATTPRGRLAAVALPNIRVRGVPRPRLRLEAVGASPLPDCFLREPRFATTAPLFTQGSSTLSLRLVRTGSNPAVHAAVLTDVAAAVVPAVVPHEVSQRPPLPAPTALLLALRATSDETRVGRTSVLRRSHIERLRPPIRLGKKSAGRTHDEMPA